MNDITHTLGLLRFEVRDARAITSNLETQVRRQVEPLTMPRPGGPGRQVRRLQANRHQAKAVARCR
jgi:hypothetical protein